MQALTQTPHSSKSGPYPMTVSKLRITEPADAHGEPHFAVDTLTKHMPADMQASDCSAEPWWSIDMWSTPSSSSSAVASARTHAWSSCNLYIKAQHFTSQHDGNDGAGELPEAFDGGGLGVAAAATPAASPFGLQMSPPNAAARKVCRMHQRRSDIQLARLLLSAHVRPITARRNRRLAQTLCARADAAHQHADFSDVHSPTK